jgi:hypothetical protein
MLYPGARYVRDASDEQDNSGVLCETVRTDALMGQLYRVRFISQCLGRWPKDFSMPSPAEQTAFVYHAANVDQ